MSHLVLRRVMVRLLHDPAFVDALHAQPARALEGLDLDASERRWLLGTPRAAWRTDAERPQRVLAALLDEFPASAALAPERLRTFFASEAFHRAVQERGSLALAFGAHLAGDLRTADVARLETEIARVRRAPEREAPSPAGRLRRSAHAGVLGAAGDTLERRAGRTPPPATPVGSVDLLVLRHAGGEVTVEEIPEGLAAVLRAADGPRPVAALSAVARAHGADPGEDTEILQALVSEGLLV